MHALYTETNNDPGGAMPNGVEMLSLTENCILAMQGYPSSMQFPSN